MLEVTQQVENKGGVVCAAMDSALSGSEACYSATWVLPPHMANDAMEDGISMGPGVEVDLSTGLKTLRLRSAPGEKASNEEVVLDLGVEVRDDHSGLWRPYLNARVLLQPLNI